MIQERLSRRQFSTAAIALTTAGLAGCSDDETAAGDDDGDETFNVDDPGDLTIHFENEDGEPVSTGVEVVIENEAEDFSTTQGDEIQDGELLAGGLIYEGEYTITVESVDDEFDAVEETVTLEEGEDEEITLVLDGAMPDSEIDDEDGDE